MQSTTKTRNKRGDKTTGGDCIGENIRARRVEMMLPKIILGDHDHGKYY